MKPDLDIRYVYHKSGNGTKAGLHLAILTYGWECTLKQKGINLGWNELLRIMSVQQRVTVVAEQANGRMPRVGKSIEPEAKLFLVQETLGIPVKPVCPIKFGL